MDFSRNFNDHCPDWKFRYTDITEVLKLMSPGCFMTVLDLKSWYISLGLHPPHYKYNWVKGPRTGMWRHYTRVGFGMKLAPAFASAISGQLVAILKGLGILRSSVFIDDIIIVANTFDACKQQLDLALATIRSIGFEVQDKKILQHSQQQIYLGYTLDLVARTFSVSESKQADLLLRLISLADFDFVLSCLQMASLCGALSHFSSVMPGACSYLRRLWRSLAIMPRQGFHSISQEGLLDLSWWIDRLLDPSWPDSRMWLTETDFVVVSMKSDASGDDGYGYHVGDFEYCRMWTLAELDHNIQ